MKIATVLATLCASAAFAQIPIPDEDHSCEGLKVSGENSLLAAGRTPVGPVRREFAIPSSSFCSDYTYPGGWEDTLQLHLGEGAAEHWALVENAFEL